MSTMYIECAAPGCTRAEGIDLPVFARYATPEEIYYRCVIETARVNGRLGWMANGPSVEGAGNYRTYCPDHSETRRLAG